MTTENRETWEGRFNVGVIADDFPCRGHRFDGVRLTLFRVDMEPEEATALLETCGLREADCNDELLYLASQVEETFAPEQVEAIQGWLATEGIGIVKVTPARKPERGFMGVSAIPLGGFQDAYMFCRLDGYPLPFEVLGYYDVRDIPCKCHNVTWESHLVVLQQGADMSRVNIGEDADGKQVEETYSFDAETG